MNISVLSKVIFLFLISLLVACTPLTKTAQIQQGAFPGTPIVPGAPAALKIGIVVFLSGGAAEPFGIPAHNGAEIILAKINSGNAPTPYSIPGIAGVPVQAVYVDENGGAEKQAQELRRLYEEEKVDLVIGYISSGDCLAAAPVAEELKKLLVVFDCGTSRLFEDNDYKYVFRTNAHQAIDSIAGARYLLHIQPDIQRVAGINQNYSWGQDSWAHFRSSLRLLKPDVEIVSEQFPKLNAETYRGELNALAAAAPQYVHSSFWGVDLKNLIAQANQVSFLSKTPLLLSVGESAIPQVGQELPVGTILGAHGPHGFLAPSSALNDWLVEVYQEAYGQKPTYPVYHMAQAILGVKLAIENAASEAQTWPTAEQINTAFEYLTFPTPSGEISLSIGGGHQAVEPAAYGVVTGYDPHKKEIIIGDIMIYPAECVNPPEGKTTEQWIREGFPGAACP